MLPAHATVAGTSPNQGFMAEELRNTLLRAQYSPVPCLALLPDTACWGEAPSPLWEMLQPPQLRDANRSPYLASQVQHVSVGIVEREKETRQPIDLLLYQGHGQVFLRKRKKHFINQDVPMLVLSGVPVGMERGSQHPPGPRERSAVYSSVTPPSSAAASCCPGRPPD